MRGQVALTTAGGTPALRNCGALLRLDGRGRPSPHKLMKSSVETKAVQSAEAGHWGKDVRSDLHVAIEARDGGGVEVTLESRVAPYYGDSIRAQARQVLESLGVKHAR